MVTHRLTAIEQFDELCVIDEAKLIEKGTYAELLQLEKGFFKQLVERVRETEKISIDIAMRLGGLLCKNWPCIAKVNLSIR